MDDFEGDLVCVQLDRSRAPTGGNALRGVATLLGANRDVAKYAAVGVSGNPVNDADGSLCLGGAPRESCARGAEYAACPASWLVSLRAEGLASDSGPDAPTLRNRFIVATCSRQAGNGAATLQVLVLSELEQRFSTSIPMQRWADIGLADLHIFDRDLLGADFVQARLRAASPGPGIVVAALADWVASDGESIGGAAAAVPHPEGARSDPDRIVFHP